MIPEDTFGGLHLGLTGASHFRFTVRVLDPRDLSRNKQREPSQSEVLGTGRQMEGAPARWPRPRPAALGRQESETRVQERPVGARGPWGPSGPGCQWMSQHQPRPRDGWLHAGFLREGEEYVLSENDAREEKAKSEAWPLVVGGILTWNGKRVRSAVRENCVHLPFFYLSALSKL